VKPLSSKLSVIAITLCLCASGNLAIGQALFPKIEASFNITGISTDPAVLFDYAQTDVEVAILQPDSSTVILPAFYDGGTTWRVRHSPTLAGNYAVTGVTLNGSSISVSTLQPGSWTVAGEPVYAGFVQVDPLNPRRFITSNGRRFFPKGQDVAWDVGISSVTNVFAKMGAAHENWSRVWMDHWDGKNLDWNPDGSSPGALGVLNLTVARKWDGIVAAADQAGISFQMTLQHHGQYSSTVDPNWGQNPYNVTNPASTIGFLSNPIQFFTNTTAIAVTKRKLRYAIARWGYSPAIMAWELFNEVQYTDAAQTGQWGIVGAWHDQMAAFMHAQDPYHHLVTTSSDLTQPIWNQCDYYTHHDYPNDVIAGLRDAPDISASQPVKPVFGAECATNGTPHLGVNAPLWSGLMAAQSGNEEPWWWDGIDAENDYIYFQAMSDFVTRSGLGDQAGLTKLSPQVSGGPPGPLSFAPSGGWATASQDTFTVGAGAPDGIGAAPSYLQGNYHRSMTPNGYTFLVNYPQPGTFSVQVVVIAASGAGLEIFLDNVVQTNIAWTGTGSDLNTNFMTTIPVPAGSHSIQLWNPGLDWIDLGNLTLNPYVPLLGAYAVGNTNFTATWVWHRTNLFNAAAGPAVAGTVSVAGLNPGSYSATWWDTFAGGATTNFMMVVPDTNAVILNTPAVLRSAALYVGQPAQAALTAPSLIQTLGTNSPVLVLPVTITNSGGLPLGYSLSITGATSAAYTAMNSSQPGGPIYAWKDISGVGTDITSTFTALAGPKTAKDEGIAGPFNIGFAFPFFSGAQASGVFTQLYVSPNGFVTFSPFSGDTSTNKTLPNISAPSNCIAFFWRDLDLTSAGKVYTAADPINGTFTVQFQSVPFKSSGSTVTCQLVLRTTGEILAQYQSMSASNSCTVGVQNAARNQGTTVVFNGAYLQSTFAVRLTPTSWFNVNAGSGFVSGLHADTIFASFNPAGMGYGTNLATLLISTTDGTHPLFTLPVEFDLTSLATWRQTHFGTAANSGLAADTANPAGDGLINIIKYAFNLDPNLVCANPISYQISGNHLTITFKRTSPPPPDIAYLYEVATDLTSGIWNSGPTYTSQAVTNNGDVTETVTVTDLGVIGASPTHFLRVRIAH
jgi:hypothetical protein